REGDLARVPGGVDRRLQSLLSLLRTVPAAGGRHAAPRLPPAARGLRRADQAAIEARQGDRVFSAAWIPLAGGARGAQRRPAPGRRRTPQRPPRAAPGPEALIPAEPPAGGDSHLARAGAADREALARALPSPGGRAFWLLGQGCPLERRSRWAR